MGMAITHTGSIDLAYLPKCRKSNRFVWIGAILDNSVPSGHYQTR